MLVDEQESRSLRNCLGNLYRSAPMFFRCSMSQLSPPSTRSKIKPQFLNQILNLQNEIIIRFYLKLIEKLIKLIKLNKIN